MSTKLNTVNKKDLSDQKYDQIMNFHRRGILPYQDPQKNSKFRSLANLFTLIQTKLYIYVSSKTLNTRFRRLELVSPRDRIVKLQALYDDILTQRNGRDSFYFFVIERYVNIPRSVVMDFLRSCENYQLHLVQRREKTVQPDETKDIGKLYIDLIVLSDMKGFNNQRGYLLTAIDVFSKYAFVRAITRKTADNTLNALELILEDYNQLTGKYPDIIHSDNGKEFKNKSIRPYRVGLWVVVHQHLVRPKLPYKLTGLFRKPVYHL